MRVLAVSDFYLPRAGGVERVVHETARRLDEEGVAVEVLTRRLEPTAPSEETQGGVRVYRLGRAPAPLPLELARLRREARGWSAAHLGRFDLVHAHLTLTALPLVALARARGLPVVATFYGPWREEYEEELRHPAAPSRLPAALRAPLRPLVGRYLERLQRRVLGAAQEVIVLSRHSQGELARYPEARGKEVRVIHGGVDVERLRPRDRREARRRLGLVGLGDPLVASVRRLVPRMGLEALVDAVALLAAARPRLALAIGGTGPLARALERRAAERGLGARVRLLGHVPEDDLPWLYAAADLTAVPSRALEGFGLPVLESWACGVPAVVTPVGALPEVAAELDPALVAAGTDAAAIAAALERGLALVAGPEGRELAERARRRAESHSWEVVSRAYASVYHDVLGRPPDQSPPRPEPRRP